MKSSTFAATVAIASAPLALASVPNGVYFDTKVEPAADGSQKCIIFSEENVTWYYTLNGVWGDATGKGTSYTTICVPTGPTGGAMFIGPDPNPGPGSTKLECQFPTSGTAYCDLSLVDGYSQAVNCYANDLSARIGGDVSLYETGIACPDKEGVNCINTVGGSASSQSQVNAFFQPAVENNNNYCIWHDCNIPNFPVANEFVCEIYAP